MEPTKDMTAREAAQKSLSVAIAHMRADNNELAEEHILDVLDQLSHWCGNKRYWLYSPGEDQPVGSRLRYAFHVLGTGGMALFRSRNK